MDIFKRIIFIILSTSLMGNCLLHGSAQALTLPKQKSFLVRNEFLGKWNMLTIVTNSNCPYVIVGSTTESDLEIKPVQVPTKKFSFKALWKGGKWSTSNGTIKLLNDKEAITERITEFKTNDKNNWKAVLIDHLKLDENNIMHSESIVIQYKNGEPVGEYKTISILTKSD